MKQKKLITAMAFALSLSLASCSDDKQENTHPSNTATKVTAPIKTQAQSSLLQYIPADTPILGVYTLDPNHPLPENFKNKMDKLYSSVGDIIKMAMEDALNKTNNDSKKTEMSEFIDKWVNEDGFKKLGLNMEENEMALYAVDLFPVLRLTLANGHSMNEILNDLLAKANESKDGTGELSDINGTPVYQYGDNELKILVALNGNSLVISFAPTREVKNLAPQLLGMEKPSKNITQSNQYQDTISKYNYLSNSLYWINIRQIADYFINPSQHKSALLDMMQIKEDAMSADCKTEILEIFDKFPRMVGGTSLLSEHEMKSHFIIELADGLGSKLSTMTGRIPTASKQSAINYGFSFDIVGAKALAQEFVTNIETTPYKCEFFAGVNQKAAEIKTMLAQPLPPFVSNFKGMNIAIDELELDLSKTEPNEMIKSLKASVLMAVDNPESLQGMAEMMMPELQKLGLKAGENAVNVSSLVPVSGTQIPINLDHVFLAMGSETIGVSLGEGTDVTLTNAVSLDSKENLLQFKITADLYKNIFDGLGEMTASMPEEARKQIKMQQMMMSDMIWWNSEEMDVNFTDRGFEFNIGINY